MKKEKVLKNRIFLRPGAAVYAVIWVYALIMTQLLRSTVSNVFFWFMVTAAPLSFFVMLLGKALIQVYVHSDTASAEKYMYVNYEIRIINQSPIPYPFVEAIVTKPVGGGTKSQFFNINLSLIPFGGYRVLEKVSFKYRGLYEIGVRELYITDVLHLFKYRVVYNNFSNVTVSPAVLKIRRNMPRSVSEIPSQFVRTDNNTDRSEISNIREYLPGDSIKNIHWKLSSKSDNLQIREFSTNDDKRTYIFADMSAPTLMPPMNAAKSKKKEKISYVSLKDFSKKIISTVKEKIRKEKYIRRRSSGLSEQRIKTIEMIDSLIKEKPSKEKNNERQQIIKAQKLEEMISSQKEKTEEDLYLEKCRKFGGKVLDKYISEMPECSVDGVAEITVCTALEELKCGNKCTVIWYSQDGAESLQIENQNDFSELLRRFSITPVVEKDKKIKDIVSAYGGESNVCLRVVTANADPASVGGFCDIPKEYASGGDVHTEILLYNPREKYESQKDRAQYIEALKERFMQMGISLCELGETTDHDGEKILCETVI